MKELPRITVVTPTFNRSDFLEETILSVLNQNYPNLEYIIVDGGSTNHEVLDLIRKYEQGLAWWKSEPDRGHAEAVGKGFAKSTGDVLAWLCSDDTYLPGALKAVGETFLQHRADIVYGHANSIDAESRVIRNLRVVRYSRLSLLKNHNIHQASVFWTREIYQRAGGYVGGKNLEYANHSPDADLYYRFVRSGARWLRVHRTLSTFRIHPEQFTTRDVAIANDRWWKAAKEAFPIATKPVVFQVVSAYTRARRLPLLLAQGDSKYVVAKFTGRTYPY